MNTKMEIAGMNINVVIAIIGIMSFSAGARNLISGANQIDRQQQSPHASAQTSQFGQLVGDWKIKDYSLNPQGKWLEGNGANWNFYWILGGTAIQDDWISPSLDKPEPDKGRQYGTNIRIYNPKQGQWDMAWASNSGAKIDTFSAREKNRQLIMRGLFNGRDSKITFFDITATHFSWKLEQKNVSSGEWSKVYRIEASRIK